MRKGILKWVVCCVMFAAGCTVSIHADVQRLTVGQGESYETLSQVFQDLSLHGEITVEFSSDVTEVITDTPLQIPDRFSSLTMQAKEGVQAALFITHAKGTVKYQALYANGKNLDLRVPVSEASWGGRVSVFAGGYEKDVSASPVIRISSDVTGTLYGGGFNSSLHGNPQLIIENEGKISTVYGGGLACAPATYSDTLPLEAVANIDGNISLVIHEGGSAGTMYGGGRAMTTNRASGSDIYTAQADVFGNIELQIDGQNDTIHGGGSAGHDALTGETDYEASADVHGDIRIVYGAESSSMDAYSMQEVYGGGYAQTGNSLQGLAHANVIGDVTIYAEQDADAAVSQENSHAFSRLFGGGVADGNQATANIDGNTYISTARPCWESAMGIFGGGWAYRGGTANVRGQTSVSVRKIDGQKGNYENANGIYGGGYAGGGSPLGNPSTATVGSTKITIHPGAQLISGSTLGVSISGGGLAKEGQANADVLTDVDILLEGTDETASVVERGIYGAGIAVQGSDSANVHGNVRIVTKGTAANPISVEYSVYGAGTAKVEGTSAGVSGTVTMLLEHITSSDDIWIKGSGSGNGSSAVAGRKDLQIAGDVTASLLYDFDEAVIQPNGTLSLTSTGNQMLYQVHALSVPKDARLQLANNAWVSGNFNGGGTLALPADKYLYVEGKAAEHTALEIIGEPLPDQTYVYVEDADSGTFSYQGSQPYTMKPIAQSDVTNWKLVRMQAPAITMSALMEGRVAEDYEEILTAIGDQPLRWSVIAGTLPDGLHLQEDGKITGIPLIQGTYTFTVQVQNHPSLTDTREYTLLIKKAIDELKIETVSVKEGVLGQEYLEQLTATGEQPITWSVIDGALPSGIQLEEDGTLKGTPTETGTFTFKVRAENTKETDEKTFIMQIYEQNTAPVITTEKLPDATQHAPYEFRFSATGAHIRWTLMEGQLPDGIVFYEDGTLRGTPTVYGSYTFRIQAENEVLPAATQEYTLNILPQLPVISTSTLAKGVEGSPYHEVLKADQNIMKWSLLSGKLPVGIQLMENGELIGAPEEYGTFSFCVQAETVDGRTAEKEIKLVIEKLQIILGGASIWVSSTPKEMVFSANGDYEDFMTVMMDGSIVDAASYDVRRGSTIITLKPEYLKTLSAGSHTLRINYKHDRFAETMFEIRHETSSDTLPPELPEEPPLDDPKLPVVPEQFQREQPATGLSAKPAAGSNLLMLSLAAATILYLQYKKRQ